MDFFIQLASVCGIFGNGEQSNYAAGNTFQDALAEYRVSCGEKAVVLDLGIVLDEGFLAENHHIMDRLLRLRLLRPISQEVIFALLDHFCNSAVDLPPSFQSQAITGLELPAAIRAKGLAVPTALQQPMFRRMHEIAISSQASLQITEHVLNMDMI